MPLIERQPDALARTYAGSLFTLAEREGGKERAEEVLGELESLLEAARQNPKFSEFLSSRVLGARERDASLERMLTGKASDLALKFLRVLNRKDRLGHLPAITRALAEKVQEAFGRVEVDVFTAQPLDDAGKDAVRAKIADSLGHDVIIHAYTDPAMLGGVKLRVGDRLIDDSVATQLRRARSRLIDQGAPALRGKPDTITD